MNETLKSLYERKSVRVFEDRPVPEEAKQSILRAAFEAPTAGNQMLYTILDITDPALKERLAVTCDDQPFIAKAPLVFIFLADCRRWPRLYELAGEKPRAAGPGDLFLAIADACLAAQNAVVAAESLGLGSCYIGDILENCEQHRQMLNLPEFLMPACMLVMGYPTEAQKARTKPARFDARYVVFENRFRDLSGDELQEMWESRERAEGKPRALGFHEAVQAFCRRKYLSGFSREMSRSAKLYLRDFEGFDPEA
jgi:nitroreductase